MDLMYGLSVRVASNERIVQSDDTGLLSVQIKATMAQNYRRSSFYQLLHEAIFFKEIDTSVYSHLPGH